jgi:hypothetical protein
MTLRLVGCRVEAFRLELRDALPAEGVRIEDGVPL